MVDKYVINAMAKITHPRTVFHCLKVQFFIVLNQLRENKAFL